MTHSFLYFISSLVSSFLSSRPSQSCPIPWNLPHFLNAQVRSPVSNPVHHPCCPHNSILPTYTFITPAPPLDLRVSCWVGKRQSFVSHDAGSLIAYLLGAHHIYSPARKRMDCQTPNIFQKKLEQELLLGDCVARLERRGRRYHSGSGRSRDWLRCWLSTRFGVHCGIADLEITWPSAIHDFTLIFEDWYTIMR